MRIANILIMISVLFMIAGCSQEITCNKPYLLVGSECCLDKDDNSICDKDETITSNIEDRSVESDNKLTNDDKSNNVPQNKDYDIEQLKDNINKIYNSDNLNWKEDGLYYNVEPQKLIVIENVDEKLVDINDFEERYASNDWQGYGHFLGDSYLLLNRLHTKYDSETFETESKYREYSQKGYQVEQKIIEKTIELDEGYVKEYQNFNWLFSQYGYHVGSYVDTLLIYKIYCSPDLVVFLRPKWEDMRISWRNAKSETAYGNWESIVRNVRENLLNKSNEILKTCPVEKSYFENINKNDFESVKSSYYYYPIDFERNWDFKIDISEVELVPVLDNKNRIIQEKYALKTINVVFENNDDLDLLGEFYVDVKVINKDKIKDDFSLNKVVDAGNDGFTPNEKKSLEIKSMKLPSFYNEIEVEISFHVVEFSNYPIKANFLIDSNGTIKII